MGIRGLGTGFAGAAAFITALAWIGTARADDFIDIEHELAYPGTKLVVVEFYATWCKPCMEAVPRWKALQRRYGSRGLRFIVISAEGNKTCSKAPDWTPDKSLCDTDGKLTDRFGVRQLPQSFLYSWQGNLSMTAHEVEPIEEAVRNYFLKSQLFILVDKVEVIGDKYAISSNPEGIRKFIISRMMATSRFDVVSAANQPQHKAAPSGGYDTEFQPNSTLRITVLGNMQGDRQLTLELEKDGSIKASATEPFVGVGAPGSPEKSESLEKAATAAVSKLVDQLVRQVARAKDATPVGPAVRGPAQAKESFVASRLGVLEIVATPEGAEVEIYGPGDFFLAENLPLRVRDLDSGTYT
ncbi:MAG: TlpA disulfide reductase family protein, partial [Myxococcota bacterium]